MKNQNKPDALTIVDRYAIAMKTYGGSSTFKLKY